MVRDLLLLAPGLKPEPSESSIPVLPLVGSPREARTTRVPQFVALRDQTVPFLQQALAATATLGTQLRDLHPRMAAFWDDYAPRLASEFLLPALCNAHALLALAAAATPRTVELRENAAHQLWWIGINQYRPLIAHLLAGQATLHTTATRWYGAAQPLAAPGLSAGRGYWYFRRLRRSLALGRGPEPAAVDALLLACGELSVPMFTRLEEGMRELGDYRLGVLDLRFGVPLPANRPEAPTWPLAQFLSQPTPGRYARAVADAARLARRLPPLDFSAHFPEPLATALAVATRSHLRAVLPNYWPLYGLWREAATRALEATNPRCVVGTHLVYHPFEAAVLNLAAAQGRQRVCIQHGVWSGELDAGRAVFDLDEVLLFGDRIRREYEPLVKPGTRLTVTGHCLYDETVSRAVAARAAGAGQPPPAERARVILIATQLHEPLGAPPANWWIKGICEAAAVLGAEVWVKLHPADRQAAQWRTALAAWPRVRIIPHGEATMDDLLPQAQVLCTVYSTVVYEARLRGIPAVTVNLGPDEDWHPFAGEGGAVAVRQYEDFRPTLQALLEAPPTAPEVLERYLSDHLGPLDGQATRRICAALAAHMG